MHPLFLVRFFCNDDEEVGGKMIPLVFPVLVSFVFSLPRYLYLLYCTEAARAYKRTNLLETMRMFPMFRRKRVLDII